MEPARITLPDRSQPRWPGTLGLFAGVTAVVALVLYAGPITPSPGQIAPSIFMGAFFGLLVTVLIRSGFQQRPRHPEEPRRRQ